MVGGLIQIASYGIHDIFLIGNPQITFFKTVYRRHSNFSMEYIEEYFNGTQNFGGNLSCTLSKTGDLLHKLYIKIAIPQVAIDKAIHTEELPNNNPYLDYKPIYDTIQYFINVINFKLIQPLYKILDISNLKYSEVNSKYTVTLKKIDYVGELEKIMNKHISFFNTFRVPLSYNNKTQDGSIIYCGKSVDMSTFLNFDTYYNIYFVKDKLVTDSTIIINDLKFLLDNYLLQSKIIKKHMFEILSFYKKINDTVVREYINFAWVEFLGHQIVNTISITIGNKTIDKTNGIYMNIYNQLTNKIMHDLTYNKLIGNIPELTTYNSNPKPPYIMYVPLDFWFSKYSGLALPLIYLRFHDIKIDVALNNLVECCYYERLKDEIVIENLIKLDSVSLIVNYIYLDTDERQKFAQLSHEYLIDQIQILNYTGADVYKSTIELPFFNPIKQLFWIIRDTNNIIRLKYFEYGSSFYTDIYVFDKALDNLYQNNNLIKVKTVETNISNFLSVGDTIEIINSKYYSGTYKIIKILYEYVYIIFNYYMVEDYKQNYDVIVEKDITIYKKSDKYVANSQAFLRKINNFNPVLHTTLELNGIQRFYEIDGIYTNYVQPYQHNSRTPNCGINTYSFALVPEEYQPSGFCNFNRLDLKMSTMDFDNRFVSRDISKDLQITIFAHSYNILRLAYGKAGIVLNI